jgi:hypothetical protein
MRPRLVPRRTRRFSLRSTPALIVLNAVVVVAAVVTEAIGHPAAVGVGAAEAVVPTAQQAVPLSTSTIRQRSLPWPKEAFS